MACELGLRMRATTAELALLASHRITMGVLGVSCSCGWEQTLAQLCATETPIWDVVLSHLEEMCRTHVAVTGATEAERTHTVVLVPIASGKAEST